MVEMAGRDREQPIGVISMGSNDLHLLVAASDGASRFVPLADHALLLELVARLDGATLPPAALSEALAAVGTLVQKARAAGATSVTAVGTEALREATNGSAFLALLAATFGIVAVEVSGDQEAALDYCWALFPPVPLPAGQEADPHWLVIDSGGGSTQVVLGTAPTPTWSTSLPIGAGSLAAQFLAHDPPKRKELAALAEHVVSVVSPLPRSLTPNVAVVMGGSADHLLKLTTHPEQGILTCKDLENMLTLLHDKPAAKIARAYGMPVERARLLPAGALILLQLMNHYGLATAAVKAHGIRGGFAVCYARAGEDWQHLLSLPVPTPTQTVRSRSNASRANASRVSTLPAKARRTPQAVQAPQEVQATQAPAARRTRSAGVGQ